MRVAPLTALACPLDRLPLELSEAGLRCANGHSFDRARAGYCNLLPVQHKASRDPGDSKEMVAARRRFLAAGYFAQIAVRMFAGIRHRAAEADELSAFTVLDAGCGEGYVLDQIRRQASACPDPVELRLAGIDVSKWAVQAAARRTRDVTWLVANNAHPPFAAGSVVLILCLFGFPVWDGFKSIQPPGGSVLLVDPGPDHLIELRRIIYPTVTPTGPPSLERATVAGYHLRDEETLRFVVELPTAAMIHDLVAMTPHAHRLAPTGRAALSGLDRLKVTVDVVVRRLALG